jgi:Fur family ferric uptake transcriptional regulator
MRDSTEELNAKIKREFESIFRQNGLRISEQRNAVVDVFFSTEHHLSIQDIMKQLKQRGADVSETTVKRVMNLLSEYGIAQERLFNGDVIRYEHQHIGEHHDHLICLRCRKIIEFEDNDLERVQEYIAHRYGFHILRHNTEIYGICAECYGDQEEVIALWRVQESAVFTVKEVTGGQHVRKRLASLGLAPGTEGQVIRNRRMGQMVVAIKGSRVALGQGMSRKVLVHIN